MMRKGRAVPIRTSIAMATYNGEKYVEGQLESLAKQTIPPYELVVTDDGSTDATLHIVENFARSSPFPVRVFRNETRLGFADNFIRAASLCSGDLIAFCDQDDLWLERKIEVCSQRFAADPDVVLVIHSAETFSGDPTNRGHGFPEFRTRALKRGSCNPFVSLPGFAMVIRRDILQVADNRCRPRKVYNHDLWAWYLASSIGSIVTLADRLVLYRQHGANVFGAQRKSTALQSVVDGTRVFSYREVANYEAECSAILLRSSGSARVKWHTALRQSAEKLAYRSELHNIRARLYERDLNTLGKIKAILYLMSKGAYLPDRARHRLGSRALAKDIFIALAGLPGNLGNATPVASPEER